MVGSFTEAVTQKEKQESNTQSNVDLPLKIRELQLKIQDENYLDYAIDRIAVIMSRHIVDSKSLTGNSIEYLLM